MKAAPLSWSAPAKPNDSCHYDHAQAETPFGVYLITWKSWKDYPGYSIEFRDEFIIATDSLDEAKEAAQADFDKRIMASCAPSPHHESP